MISRALSILLIFICSSCCYGQSQFFSQYHALEVIGNIPEDFLESSKERYEKNASAVAVNQQRATRKAEDRFFEINGFSSEMIRYSGRVLLNDTISTLLNGITDRLLKDAPNLRKRISVYTMRSAAVNAFATPDGMIMVNLGLIARMKNEDELAFVLAHEIAHIYKQHSRNNYMQKYRFETGTNTSKDYERSWEFHSYSQFSEIQADSLGYDLYTRAGYKPIASLYALATLGYAEYPFVNEKLNLESLESKRFKLPPDALTRTFCEPITDEGGGSESTHPALSEREFQVLSFLADNVDTVSHLDSSYSFYQEVALFECAKYYNQDGDWVNGFYHTSKLLEKYPSNIYLERELARSCYIAAICRNRKTMDYYKGECGEALRFHALVYSQSREQSNVMLLRIIWDIHIRHPEDKDILWYAFGTMTELVTQNNITSTFFNYNESEFLTTIGIADTSSLHLIDSAYGSWLQSTYVAQDKALYKYSFQMEATDATFQNLFRKAELITGDTLGVVNEVMSGLVGDAPTSDGVMCFTPFTYYENITRKQDESVNFKNMAKIRSDIITSMTNSSEVLNIPITILNPASIKKTSASSYNTMGLLCEWVDTKIVFEDSSILVMPFPVTTIKRMEEDCGGSRVINSGYIQLQAGRELHPYSYLIILMSVTTPNLAWTVTKPHFAAAYYFQVFNLRTGCIEYNEFVRTDHQVYRSSLISTHVHHSLRLIKNR